MARDYVRCEFVVNQDKHPDVAKFIEDPKNAGKISAFIVTMLEFFLWGAKNMEGKSLEELITSLKSLSGRTDRLLAIVEGATETPKAKSSSGKELHRSALDSL